LFLFFLAKGCSKKRGKGKEKIIYYMSKIAIQVLSIPVFLQFSLLLLLLLLLLSLLLLFLHLSPLQTPGFFSSLLNASPSVSLLFLIVFFLETAALVGY
jgi:hypothetical protein